MMRVAILGGLITLILGLTHGSAYSRYSQAGLLVYSE